MRELHERGIQRSDLQEFLRATQSSSQVLYFVDVILQAGKTNDPFWIPHLKPLLKKKKIGTDDISGAARLALAKLGETTQLQEIGCEADFGSPSMRSDAVRSDLPYLKGWFSINLLAGWLDEAYKESNILRDKPGGDEVYFGPPELALHALPELLPDVAIRKAGPLWLQVRKQEVLAPIRQAWREWINQNKESLRKQSPTGEGLDVTRSTCKIVLAHDRHIDRSRLTQ